MYTYAHIHTHIGVYVLTKHTLTYISTQLSLYIYYYLIIILLSNDSSKLPFVSYGYILKTAVAQVHTAPIQTQRGRTQAGMAGLTPACVKSQNQRLAELSLSHHPAHSVCWLQRSVLPFAQALCPLSQLFSFHFILFSRFLSDKGQGASCSQVLSLHLWHWFGRCWVLVSHCERTLVS